MNSNLPIHGGNIFAEANKLGCNPNEIIDASASIVPLKAPISFKDHLNKSISDLSVRNYPDSDYSNLRKVIGNLHNIDPEMILPGNGASELFTWAAKDASSCGISSIPAPGFADYSRALKCWEASFLYAKVPIRCKDNKARNFNFEKKADVLWINNPHNPTGILWNKKSIESIIKDYQLVICDEAFLPLVPFGEKQSLIPLVESNPNLIVIRSLTKLFAIPGLRLGYAVANSKRICRWKKWRDPWPVNAIAANTGELILKDHQNINSWKQEVHSWISGEGQKIYTQLTKIKAITPYPSSANYFLIEGIQSLKTMRERLYQKKILVRDCKTFLYLGENWLRISLQTPINNIRIIKEINQHLTED